MSNFISAFLNGKEGRNIGLSTGLSLLDKAINGIQKRSIIGIAAAPKVGKSKMVNAHFVLYPYLLNPNADIEWIYFSYEMDRVQMEFAFAVFFLWYDHDLSLYKYNNKSEWITTDYLMGRLKDTIGNPIIVTSEIEEKLKVVYTKRIIPLFGEYDNDGKRIKKGKIDFIEFKMTVSEMSKHILGYAAQNGTLFRNEAGKVVSYKPTNPDKFTIIITDTLRKIKATTGQTDKKSIADAWISDSVMIRNLTMFTFIHIIHTNRSLSNMERLKYMSEYLHPTGDDIKDTGNLSEEADYVLTLFNANDEKYGIKKHFGLDLFDQQGNLLYPDYRSMHLVESRHTICPLHMQLELNGATGFYKKLGE
jgi:hypothetical protein